MAAPTYTVSDNALLTLNTKDTFAYITGASPNNFEAYPTTVTFTALSLLADASAFDDGTATSSEAKDKATFSGAIVTVGVDLAKKVVATELVKLTSFPTDKLITVGGKYFTISSGNVCNAPKAGDTAGLVEACGTDLRKVADSVTATNFLHADGGKTVFFVKGTNRYLQKGYKELFPSSGTAKVFIQAAPAGQTVEKVVFSQETQKLVLTYKTDVPTEECFISEAAQTDLTKCTDLLKSGNVINAKGVPVWDIVNKQFLSTKAITAKDGTYTIADNDKLKMMLEAGSSGSLMWLWIFLAVVLVLLVVVAVVVMRQRSKK